MLMRENMAAKSVALSLVGTKAILDNSSRACCRVCLSGIACTSSENLFKFSIFIFASVARQQLQAAQAKAAQSASARGGVGAQQTAARIEAIRNQLLQQQNDYGLKLTSIGDQIALGAIRTGLQADQYANQLTASYFTNIMRTLAGTPTVTQTTQTTTTGA